MCPINSVCLFSRKELTDLSVDLAATPVSGLKCRASPCTRKEEPHPDFPFVKTTILLTDDIAHMVVSCSFKCRIGYHLSCWTKIVREQRREQKEFKRAPGAKLACPTPDCHGLVIREEQQ